MHLAEVSWTDVAAASTPLAALPVGSIEQHGPHAPLGTDAMAATAIADAGARRCDREVVVAPPIQVGVAAEHRSFAGTLWVSEDTFRAYVRETIESLGTHGFTRVVVVNGHGGNVGPLRECCGRVSRAGETYAVPYTWFDAIDRSQFDEDVAMGHGGPLETSLMQYLHAEFVHEDRFAEARDGAAPRWGDRRAGVNLAYDTDEFSESGIVGDPSAGSVELGEGLFETASDQLAELFVAVAERDFE